MLCLARCSTGVAFQAAGFSLQDAFSFFQLPKGASSSPSLPPPEKQELLDLIDELEAAGAARGSESPVDQGLRLLRLIEALEAKNPHPDCVSTKEGREVVLSGDWKLVMARLCWHAALTLIMHGSLPRTVVPASPR